MKTLTDVYGFDGADRKDRYYVKKLMKTDFGEKIIFLTTSLNDPQVALRFVAYSTGELFHQSNKENILKRAAKILRDDVDMFIQNEKQTDPVWPPTVQSLSSCRERYPLTLNSFFITLLKAKTNVASESTRRAAESMIDDVIHSVSNGSILTLKHTLNGCGIHSMTGSRQTIEIMSSENN